MRVLFASTRGAGHFGPLVPFLDAFTGAGHEVLVVGPPELDARPMADTLYHALAGALLLAEGERLWQEGRGARKLLTAALYLRKWLRPPAPPASVFTARECEWLSALVDWTPVPAEALAEPAGGS